MSAPSEQESFGIREADWVRDQAALFNVRTRVFVEEQGVPPQSEWDSADPGALHLLAFDAANHAIGTARVLPNGQIGRMAVLWTWRGRGVGTALLQEALKLASGSDRPAPFVNAQRSAVPFYQRQGFRCTGVEFYEAGIPHRRMLFEGPR